MSEPTTVDEPAAEPSPDVAGLKSALDGARGDADTWRRKAGEYRTEAEKVGDLQSQLDQARRELEASKVGVSDEELAELVNKTAGTQLQTASQTIDKLTAERDDYRSKYDALVLEQGARAVLVKAGVRETALGDALDKVGKFYETKDGALTMRDLESLGVDESVKKQLLTAKGSPADLEAFASGYLRENYSHYFPAVGGSGAARADNGQAPSVTAKTLTQKQIAQLSQQDFERWRMQGGRASD